MRYKIGDLVFDEQISKYIIVLGYFIQGVVYSENFDKLIRAPLVYIFYDGILHEEAIQDFDFDEFVQLKYRIKL